MLLRAKILDRLERIFNRRIAVTAQECLACVQGRAAHRDDHHLEVFEKGWDFIVVIVARATVYRFPRTRLSACRLLNEAQFLNRFSSSSPVPVPHMRVIHDASFRFPYATYPAIFGIPLTPAMFQRLEAHEVQTIAQRLGAFLSVLHATPPAHIVRGFSGAGGVRYWNRQFIEVRELVFPHLSHHAHTWIARVYNRLVDAGKDSHMPCVVIHGDLSADHILINSTHHGLAGIIDFGDVDVSDPAYDFQFEYTYGTMFMREVYAHYTGFRDEGFDARRKIYEHRLPIIYLRSALEAGDKEMVVTRTRELDACIKNNPF